MKNQSEIQFVDQLVSLKYELQNLKFSFEFRAFFENISEDQKKQVDFRKFEEIVKNFSIVNICNLLMDLFLIVLIFQKKTLSSSSHSPEESVAHITVNALL